MKPSDQMAKALLDLNGFDDWARSLALAGCGDTLLLARKSGDYRITLEERSETGASEISATFSLRVDD